MNRLICTGLWGLSVLTLSACESGKSGNGSVPVSSPSAPVSEERDQGPAEGRSLDTGEKFTVPTGLFGRFETACLPVSANNAFSPPPLNFKSPQLYQRERTEFIAEDERSGRQFSWLEIYAGPDCSMEQLLMLVDLRASYRIRPGGELELDFESQNVSLHTSRSVHEASRHRFCEISEWRLHQPLAVEKTSCDRNVHGKSLQFRVSQSQTRNLRVETCSRTDPNESCQIKTYLLTDEGVSP